MIPINSNKVELAKKLYAKEIKDFTDKAVKKIKALKSRETKLNAAEVQYLDNLIAELPQLVIAKPTELKTKIRLFPVLPKRKIAKPKKGPKVKTLTQKIIIAMGYTELRDEFLAKYFQSIGIKTCVYCNSVLTVTTESSSGIISAKFQVDHYRSKNTYPCFSISLYNLYPVCGPCNNIKKEKMVELDLYIDNLPANPVSRHKFALDRASIAKYIVSRNFEDLKIIYSEDPTTLRGAVLFQQVFDIHGIYNTQKDVAEELIIKARIYNKPYKKMLASAFPKLFSDNSLSSRVLIGNYIEVENIHKRPLAKFTQDIAKQLGLL